MPHLRVCEYCGETGWVTCWECDGQGTWEEDGGENWECEHCDGKGETRCPQCYL